MCPITPEFAVIEYQCTGCTRGPDPQTCPQADVTSKGCTNHQPGTMGFGIGTFALGLPKGFNRFGRQPAEAIAVYESYDTMMELVPNLKTKYSVPVWKHLDQHGNTIVRWFSPRTNAGWTNVIVGDCRDKFPNAIEITKEDVEYMD